VFFYGAALQKSQSDVFMLPEKRCPFSGRLNSP